MIKTSYREQIHKGLSGPSIKEKRKRFTEALIFVNEVFESLFRGREDVHKCYGCKAKEPISFENSKRVMATFINSYEGELFQYNCCDKCKGTGYIDFISNVRRDGKRIYWNYRLSFPTTAYDFTDYELASTIFYLMYYKHNYMGFDINLNDPDNNNIKDIKIEKFIEHLSEYKKERDKRKIFIDNHFLDLKKSLLDKTKIVAIIKGRSQCNDCRSQPFNLVHNKHYDTIELGICGKCYGLGYQTIKDTIAVVSRYFVNVESPDYSDIDKMLANILLSADNYRDDFYMKLNQLKYREQPIKTRRAAIPA